MKGKSLESVEVKSKGRKLPQMRGHNLAIEDKDWDKIQVIGKVCGKSGVQVVRDIISQYLRDYRGVVSL